jgi:glycosyltransferase involved in cell wall biosynthesis
MLDFSLIICTYNSGKSLELTLNSILKQNFDSYEVVMVDRESSAETEKIIKKYVKIFQGKLRFIICPRELGIYEAMNRGVKMARGNYITLIEAGMELEDNSLAQALKSAQKYPQADATYGVWGPWEKSSTKRELVNVQAESLPIKNTQFINLYYKKDLHQKFGFYGAKENVIANYAFCLKAFYLGGAIVRPFEIKINSQKEISNRL